MEGPRSRTSSRRHSLVAGLTALTFAAGTSLLGSAAIASPSWAAGSNGEAAKSATTVLADAKHATEKSHSVHVFGAITQQGSTTSFNIKIGHNEGGGTVSQGGVSFDIVLHRTKVYLKAGKATWTKLANATAAALLAGRWIQTTTANKDYVDLAKLMDIDNLTNQLTPSGKLIKKRTTAYHGQSAIPLFDSGPGGGTLYVAARGTPYVLGITGTKSTPGSLRFTGYNATKIPPAPKNSINLNALEAAGSGGSSTTTAPSGAGAATIPTVTTIPTGSS